MSSHPAVEPAAHSRYLPYKAAAAALLGLKLVALLSANLFSDEAYYWMWGQHPGLSYYDHPPLNGWLLGVSDAVFGNSLFGLRFWAIVTTAGTIAIFRAFARRIGGVAWRGIYWRGLVIYLATPAFGFYGSFATSDHLLLFFILLSAHFLVPYLAAARDGCAGRPRDLYLGALCMGLAGLSKYNAVFLGLALGLYVVASPRLRHLLRQPHLYGAAALTLLVASPVVIWNLSNGFASFQYHLVTRHDAGFLTKLTSRHLIEFGIQTVIILSPVLIWALGRALTKRPVDTMGRTHWGLASWLFWPSTLTFLFIGLTDQVYVWWNVSAYVLLMPMLGVYVRSRVPMWSHVGWGVLIGLFFVISSSIYPLLLVVGLSDPTRTRYYGWDELAAPIERVVAERRPDFIAAPTWEDASVTGFAIDDPNVRAITPRLNQYHFWFAPADLAGQDALVVVRGSAGLGEAQKAFESLTLAADIPIVRFGRELNHFRLYWGEGYKPNF